MPVNLLAVSNFNDEHNQCFVSYLIDHPVIPDPDSV